MFYLWPHRPSQAPRDITAENAEGKVRASISELTICFAQLRTRENSVEEMLHPAPDGDLPGCGGGAGKGQYVGGENSRATVPQRFTPGQ